MTRFTKKTRTGDLLSKLLVPRYESYILYYARKNRYQPNDWNFYGGILLLGFVIFALISSSSYSAKHPVTPEDGRLVSQSNGSDVPKSASR